MHTFMDVKDEWQLINEPEAQVEFQLHCVNWFFQSVAWHNIQEHNSRIFKTLRAFTVFITLYTAINHDWE